MRRTRLLSMSAIAATAVAVAALPAAAAAAPTKRSFTEVEAGARLSTTGNRYEDVYRIKSGTNGVGSVIRDAVLTGDTFPATGTDQATSYFIDGRLRASESFTLGVPHVDGVGT